MGTSNDISELDPVYQGAGLTIGIVMSRFNKDICEGLLSACEIELARLSEIFATADALEGLTSLGRKRPEYKGA